MARFRRAKKTMRKKRRFFRKRTTRISRPMKRTSYDGAYFAKIHLRTPVLASSTSSGGMVVHWGDSGASSTTAVYVTD